MKNVISNTKKGILMVTMCATVFGFASDLKLLIKEDSKKTALVLEHVKQGNKISIIDNSGVVLYKEQVQTNGLYKKGFDLTSLPDGDYVFEVDKDLEISTIPFHVTANTVTFNKEDETTIFKPYVRHENDLVFLTKLSLNHETVDIAIYGEYENGYELVHNEKVKDAKILEKVFQLKGDTNYKIVVNTNDKTFTKFINN
ncbi:hypothetical protein KFZ70_04515 [Tamlana fucoidanivorans]|uniref:T9SS C-terminal target domain-containing protein n=1 Tax=Allotamlana fucoidanivorans TaxID=2583814 RepID=A0A5C4SS07_9FLAO|nr:hypothetical protein [Tamlana fucoidanivorans]TNJ47214.1 hypothetical protein FGF67_01460 [Tamlana fucoidanivorans]TNJ47253.1 hypothetical protein FGF67_01660 [Tamlana fucoidanivorans]